MLPLLAKTAFVRLLTVLGVVAALAMSAPLLGGGEAEEKPPAAVEKPAPEPTEAELMRGLFVDVPEVDLDTISGTAKGLFAQAKEKTKPETAEETDRAIAELVKKRSDLRGLPMVLGEACRTDSGMTASVERMSRLARQRVARLAVAEMYVKLRKPEAVPALQQVMQTEDESERLYMTDAFAAIVTRASTVALAKRAVFDVSAKVRREAVAALRQRSADDCRPVLLQGVRHPWAPAARHAAQALIALEDRKAVPELVAMLDLSHPEQPTQRSDGRWEKQQLVRVNHLRNCQLCHAVSVNEKDPVRGQIPVPGKSLPPPLEYYDNREGDFVRADVVYLWQDFSVKQPVENHGAWPEMQRYDYLVRKQEVTEAEAKQWAERRPPSAQRKAVLHALRSLTRLNPGDSGKDWKVALARR